VFSWNAIILGHVKCGQGQKALQLFQQMQQEDVLLDPVTFVRVLNACAIVVMLEECQYVHEQMIKSGLESDVFLGNSLLTCMQNVEVYVLESVWKVFNKMPCDHRLYDCCKIAKVFNMMPSQVVVTWTAILRECAVHGHSKEFLKHFE
jgi:pentatricopeptide repeat protein